MKSTPKWLLIPPAVAVLLILGPMAMGGGANKTGSAQNSAGQPTAPADNTAAAPEATATRTVPGSLVPRTPDLWKMSSALVGVLLLGVGGLVVLKRMRGGAMPQGKASLATLRQTVRLTPKQSLHAIEFDNRILLIGESDKGLTLLDQGSLPEAVTDEAIVFARQQEAIEADDDRAVPRNLLIPRPENPPRNQTIARSNPARPAAARPTTQAKPQSKADVAIAKLNDFRTLLEKAGR